MCFANRIFFGRIAFINAELIGKVSTAPWSVIFPATDMLSRHPSQLYQAFLKRKLLFFILNIIIFKKKYKVGTCSYLFLILYGTFRIFSEQFREPDVQLGYVFNTLSMGSLLSFLMIIVGLIILKILKKMKLNFKFFKNSKILTVDNFFKNVLYDQKYGYYSTKQPFGDKGDFITAPKISILFSEMIAVWIVATWEMFGKPKNLNIVELGPGDGSLMETLLKSFKNFPEFNSIKKVFYMRKVII